MKKIHLIFLMLFIVSFSRAQVTQSFSYQFVMRDGNGAPIINRTISLQITLQSLTETPYYTERKTITTTAQGVVFYNVGEGTPTFGSFADIPWKTGNVFIKVEIDPNGSTNYTQMGNPSKLQSVPYALYSNNAKEITSQPDAADDDPIFVVKNKEGKIVFAVYQTGVRVYVEDTQNKGAKGGFAVGGLSNQAKGIIEYFRITPDSARIFVNETSGIKGAKGGFAVGGLSNQAKSSTVRNLMFVAPDSTRIYIDESFKAKGAKGGFAVGGLSNQAKGGFYDLLKVTTDSTRIYINDSNTKGAKGGFAVGGLSNQAKGGNSNFFNIETNNLNTINPSQSRILWYPLKSAFLTGQVLVESPDSVGVNSMASGYESKSIGKYSQAFGYKSIAKADYSTSIGNATHATNINSVAIGLNASALGYASFSLGESTQAIGTESYAFGYYSRAEGDWSIAMGFNARAGYKAFAVGHNTTATGLKSVALGSSNLASGETSIAIGHAAYSTENSTVAIGRNSHAVGYHSMALGISADGGAEVTTSNASFSFAIGRYAITNGLYSTAIGYQVKSDTYYGFAIGRWNLGAGNGSTWVDTDPLFEIGNGGSNASRSNALTVYKNGNLNVQGIASFIGGISSSGSVDLPIINTAINITLNSSHHTVLVDASGVTIYLPSAASCKGRVYIIKYANASNGVVNITAPTNEKIDNSQTVTINTAWDKKIVQSNGVNWFIIN